MYNCNIQTRKLFQRIKQQRQCHKFLDVYFHTLYFYACEFLIYLSFFLSFISVLSTKKTKRINVQGEKKNSSSGDKNDEEKILRDVVWN